MWVNVEDGGPPEQQWQPSLSSPPLQSQMLPLKSLVMEDEQAPADVPTRLICEAHKRLLSFLQTLFAPSAL